MKKRLLALNLALVLLLTLMPTVALADGPVVLVPDEDGNVYAEYYVNEGSDLTTEFTFIPSKSGVYRLFIEQPQAQPVSGESLALYRSGDNAESISMALNENDVDTGCVLEAGTEYTFSIENNQPGQHLIRLWFIDEAEYVEPVEISSANFPDDVFRQFVASYDINQNGLLEADELAIVYGLEVRSTETAPIQSLEGIEKFAYTKHLNITSDYSDDNILGIKELPALPNGLEYLCCIGTQLTSLPDLPDSLVELDCWGNQLTMLPDLPNGLEYLDCSYNELTSLPALPNGLLELDCNGNQITEWPELPYSLYWLDCSRNQLTMLPELPSGLQTLRCSGNQLTSLPTLPDGLQELDCSNNPLAEFPTLPDSLTTIGDWAFHGCSGLTSVTIPDSVTTIGDGAFYGCSSLMSIDIPNSVTAIGNSAFSSCSSITSVAIPDSVTTIGDSAFGGCSSLTSVTIPNSVTTISDSVFEWCSALTSVTIPNSVTTIGSDAFHGSSSLTSVTIPDSVTTIGNDAFSNCEALKSVTIPSGVTTIGDRAFEYCHALESLTIPDSITAIGDYAFSNCGSLTEINYAGTDEQWDAIDIGVGNEWLTRNFSGVCGGEGNGDNVTWSFDNGVLNVRGSGCMLENNFESPWAALSDYITEAVIEDGVTTICNSAFAWCHKLENVTIPSGITAIGDSAFYWCSSLTSIDIPDSVISIGNEVFADCCGLTTLTIPGSVKKMGGALLFGGSFQKDIDVIILDGVEEIGEYSFSGTLRGIHSIMLPSSIKRIGTHAFDFIGTVYFNGTQEQWDNIEIAEWNEGLLSTEIIFTGVHTHTTENVGYLAPTCTEDGYTGDEVCTVCGETVSTGETIPATGHSYGDDKVCDDCGHKQSVTETIQTWISDTIQSIRNFFDKIFGRI